MAACHSKRCIVCGAEFIPCANHVKSCSKPCTSVLLRAQAVPVQDRFWTKVDVRGEDDCWLWLGSATKGRGAVRVCTGQNMQAHVAAYVLGIGPMPRGAGANQTCGNGLCCNPHHLSLWTNAQRKARAENAVGMAKVYGLHDPRDGRLRYVGHTKVRHLTNRLAGHVFSINDSTPKSAWVRELLAAGLRPEIRLLEVVSFDDALTAEQRWIDLMRTAGEALLNVYQTDLAAPRPQSSREKIAAFRCSYTGWKHAPETRAKIGRLGEANRQSKLNGNIVREMRRMHASGATQVSVANHFKVSKQTVCDVVRRRKWGHVSDDCQ